jgi:LysR family glycine cleavage system transcriptional activator
VNGLGIAMGPGPLVDGDLAAGRLVEPFDLELPRNSAYYFVAPEATAEQPKIKAFGDWLREAAAAAHERSVYPAAP